MLDWLREKKQTPRAIERFWRQVLVSAINEELDRMAAVHGLQVFSLVFCREPMPMRWACPPCRLGELYSDEAWANYPRRQDSNARPMASYGSKAGMEGLECISGRNAVKADAYVLAVPFERVAALAPELGLDLVRIQARADHRDPSLVRPADHRLYRTPRCSTAPSSGCSTKAKAATFSWW